MSRRSRAIFIRLRQEAVKRVERWAPFPPAWHSPADTRRLLVPAAAAAAPDALALHSMLVARARMRFPTVHLEGRDPASLPDARTIVAEAEQILAGSWHVFNAPAEGFALSGDWRAHPMSGMSSPLRHWTQVSYMKAGGGDVKFTWELNRHHGLVRLAQAYHLTGQDAFAIRAVELLDAWMTQNPPRQGINWTSSLEVAFRAIAWCWVWHLTCAAPVWRPERTAQLIWQLWHHARYVEDYDSVHYSPNTHLTGEALGLLYVGTLFPELRGAERWRRFGTDILLEELNHQFLADGFHYERAMGYHRYHLEFYLHALLLLRGTVAPARLQELREHLHRGLAAAALLVRPDGTWPVLGDEDGGSTLRLAAAAATDLRPVLAVGATLYGAPEWLWASRRESRALAWWLVETAEWEALETMVPAAPTSTAGALPQAGYFVARDGWGANAWYCLIDAGPHGGKETGHAHTDLAHVEIARGASRLVSDPGSLTYNDPPQRVWHRSDRAHARPTVNKVPLAEPRGNFAWRTVAPTPECDTRDDGRVWTCQLTYEWGAAGRRIRHERQVALVRGLGVVVCDWLQLPASERVHWHWPVPLPPAALVVELPSGQLGGDRSIQDTGSLRAGALMLYWRVVPAASEAPVLEPHTFAPSYGEGAAGTVLTVGPVSGPQAVGIACALASDAPAPQFVVTQDELTCAVRGEEGTLVIAFSPGRAAVVQLPPPLRGAS